MYKYDKALEVKLRKVFNGAVIYAPVDEFYSRYALSEGSTKSIKLPALSLWRAKIDPDFGSAFSTLGTTNLNLFSKGTPNKVRQLFSVPVGLDYQLDVWAPTDLIRDDLLKELVYFFTKYPNIVVEYKEQEFVFPVYIRGVNDTSGISNFEDTGDIYRYSIQLEVPDARLMFYEDVSRLKYVNVDLDSEGSSDEIRGGANYE